MDFDDDSSIDLEEELFDNESFDGDEASPGSLPSYLTPINTTHTSNLAAELPVVKNPAPHENPNLSSEQRLYMLRKMAEDQAIAKRRSTQRLQQAQVDQAVANEISREILAHRRQGKSVADGDFSLGALVSRLGSFGVLSAPAENGQSKSADSSAISSQAVKQATDLLQGIEITGWNSMFLAFGANNPREVSEPACLADFKFNSLLRSWDAANKSILKQNHSASKSSHLIPYPMNLEPGLFVSVVEQFLRVVLAGETPSPLVCKFIFQVSDSSHSPLGKGVVHALGRTCSAFKRVFAGFFVEALCDDVSKVTSAASELAEQCLSDMRSFCEHVKAYLVWRYPLLGSIELEVTECSDDDGQFNPGSYNANSSKGMFESIYTMDHVVRAVIEDVLFSPEIYASLISVLGVKNGSVDVKVFNQCLKLTELSHHMLFTRLGLAEPFMMLLSPSSKLQRGTNKDTPYFAAIQLLQYAFEQKHTPHDQLKYVIATVRQIYAIIAQFNNTKVVENSSHTNPQSATNTQLAIGADELLPIFIFCIIHTRPRKLQSCCDLIDSLLASSFSTGEAQYALVLLNTSVHAILDTNAEERDVVVRMDSEEQLLGIGEGEQMVKQLEALDKELVFDHGLIDHDVNVVEQASKLDIVTDNSSQVIVQQFGDATDNEGGVPQDRAIECNLVPGMQPDNIESKGSGVVTQFGSLSPVPRLQQSSEVDDLEIEQEDVSDVEQPSGFEAEPSSEVDDLEVEQDGVSDVEQPSGFEAEPPSAEDMVKEHEDISGVEQPSGCEAEPSSEGDNVEEQENVSDLNQPSGFEAEPPSAEDMVKEHEDISGVEQPSGFEAEPSSEGDNVEEQENVSDVEQPSGFEAEPPSEVNIVENQVDASAVEQSCTMFEPVQPSAVDDLDAEQDIEQTVEQSSDILQHRE